MAAAAITAERLGKRFGPVVALDGVDLQLPAGGVLGVLGPNGAGKTTLVRIPATLLKPDQGQARVAGFDVARHPVAVRRRIGLSGQYAAVGPFQRHTRPAQGPGRRRPAGPAVPARPGPPAAGGGAVRARRGKTGRR